MKFSWYEKEVKYKMNNYKVVNGIEEELIKDKD